MPNVHARIANSRRPIIGGEVITMLEKHEQRQKEWICKICNAPFSEYKHHLGEPESQYWNLCSPDCIHADYQKKEIKDEKKENKHVRAVAEKEADADEWDLLEL